VVFTSTLPCGGKVFLKELERAIVECGLKGVLINSSHHGAYPNDDEARPFFELVTSLDIPVMTHAPVGGFRRGAYAGISADVERWTTL
jgi:predicted TIM-barrel fold metal-dependent hydrolase